MRGDIISLFTTSPLLLSLACLLPRQAFPLTLYFSPPFSLLCVSTILTHFSCHFHAQHSSESLIECCARKNHIHVSQHVLSWRLVRIEIYVYTHTCTCVVCVRARVSACVRVFLGGADTEQARAVAAFTSRPFGCF
jgi:hypothetical protein